MSSAAIECWVSEVEASYIEVSFPPDDASQDPASSPIPKRRRIAFEPYSHRQPLAIMSPNKAGRASPTRKSPRKPTPSQTSITPSRQQRRTQIEGTINTKEVTEEETPRAGPVPTGYHPFRDREAKSWVASLASEGHPFLTRPDLAPSSPLRSSASAVSESSTKTKRSRSPVKNTSDLQFANIEIRGLEQAPPSAIQLLFEDILNISDKIEVVPKALEEEATKLCLPLRIRKPSFFDDYPISGAYARQELLDLHDIVRDAACCEIECEEEAAWNTKVHYALLKLALRKGSMTTTVKHWQVTTATIVPELAPKNISTGETLRSRMVDFVLTIEPPSEGLRGLVARQSSQLQTVNQTMYAPLRLRPIAVTFETKTEMATETGKNQLAVWTKAWLLRVRLLFPPTRRLPPLPLVRVVGHSWLLMFAWEEVRDDEEGDAVEGGPTAGDVFGQDAKQPTKKGSTLVIMGDIEIGNTRSLVGVYQIVKAIRRLAIWAEEDFTTWIRGAIAASEI